MTVHGSRPAFAVELSLTTDPFDAPSWSNETAFVRSFTMTRGRQQALDVFQPGTATVEVDNSDRRFDPNYAAGPKFGTLLPGRRGRIRATYGNTHLRIPGVSTAYASTPDSAVYNVTDLDVRVEAALDDLTAATEQTLISKYDDGSANRSWSFGVTATGALRLVQSADGTAIVADVTSTATLGSVGLVDGQRIRYRATEDVNDGGGNRVVRLYYSTNLEERIDEATDWTQLGSTSTVAGVTTIKDSTAQIRIGTRTSATPLLAVGNFYAAALLTGLAGTALTCPVFTSGRRFAADATSGTDFSGRVWTIAGTADLVGQTHDVFGGFADGWPVPGLELARSAVRFTDGFELLSATPIPDGTPLDVTLRSLGPVHWWKLDEPENSAVCSDSGSSPSHADVKGAAPAALGEAGIIPGSDSTAYANPTQYPKAWIQAGTDAADWITFFCLFRTTPVAEPQVLFQQADAAAGTPQSAIGIGGSSGFGGLTSGQIGAYVGGEASKTTLTTYADGAVHSLAVVNNPGGGSDPDIYVDGVLVAFSVLGGSPGVGLFSGTRIAASGTGAGNFWPWRGTLSNVATFDYELSAAEILALSDAGDSWVGDTIDARIGRLLDLSGWRTSERDLDVSAVGILGPADLGDDALADARTLEASEGGAFYQEPDFTMRFRNRYATAVESTQVVATFTDAAGDDRFRFENPVIAPQGEWIRNRVKVSWQDGEVIVDDVASQQTYGIREHSIDSVLGTALQAQALGELILYRYAQPVDRVQSIELNLAAEPGGWEAALGVEIGDRVRVVWTPSDVGSPIDFEALVDGKTITAGSVGTARATFALSAADLGGLWIWDTSLWDTSTVWG